MIKELLGHLNNRLDMPVYAGVMAENATYPAIVYNLLSKQARLSLNKGTYQWDYVVGFDVWGHKISQVQAMADRLARALNEFKRPTTRLEINSSFEEGLFRLSIEWASFC